MFLVEYYNYMLPVGAARGGGGSFKIGKPTGEVGCCELRMVCLRLFFTDSTMVNYHFLPPFCADFSKRANPNQIQA